MSSYEFIFLEMTPSTSTALLNLQKCKISQIWSFSALQVRVRLERRGFGFHIAHVTLVLLLFYYSFDSGTMLCWFFFLSFFLHVYLLIFLCTAWIESFLLWGQTCGKQHVCLSAMITFLRVTTLCLSILTELNLILLISFKKLLLTGPPEAWAHVAGWYPWEGCDKRWRT